MLAVAPVPRHVHVAAALVSPPPTNLCAAPLLAAGVGEVIKGWDRGVEVGGAVCRDQQCWRVEAVQKLAQAGDCAGASLAAVVSAVLAALLGWFSAC